MNYPHLYPLMIWFQNCADYEKIQNPISPMVAIDGSYGEGGGQVLCTCLSLVTITGEPMPIVRIRAKGKEPELVAEHLTAVRADSICYAQMQGDALGSMMLEFNSGGAV